VTLTTGDAAAVPAPGRPGWQEERRKDRALQAQLDRDREDARIAARIKDRQSAAQLRQDAADKRDERRANRARERRKTRKARRDSLAGWVGGHVTDLLFVPVITVPGALAWTAMSSYGEQVYGPAGLALPAFSEGAMWAFAAAVTITRHRDDKRSEEDPDAEPSPVWHLQLGTGVFAGFGAALNFAHGFAAGPAHGMVASVVTGLVMAAISVAGVTVHQIVKAGPRRTRAQKDAAKIAREIRKRELETRLAAARDAVRLAMPGRAREIRRARAGVLRELNSGRLTPATAVAASGLMDKPGVPELHRAALATALGAPPRRTAGRKTGHTGGQAPDTDTDASADTRRTRRRTSRPDTGSAVTRLRDRHPDMPAADIAARLGITDRTVRRHLAARADTPPAIAAA
jgi:hypothetical protein